MFASRICNWHFKFFWGSEEQGFKNSSHSACVSIVFRGCKIPTFTRNVVMGDIKVSQKFRPRRGNVIIHMIPKVSRMTDHRKGQPFNSEDLPRLVASGKAWRWHSLLPPPQLCLMSSGANFWLLWTVTAGRCNGFSQNLTKRKREEN